MPNNKGTHEIAGAQFVGYCVVVWRLLVIAPFWRVDDNLSTRFAVAN